MNKHILVCPGIFYVFKGIIITLLVLSCRLDVMGIDSNSRHYFYAPFEIYGEGNRLTGFNVDLAREIKKYIDGEYDIKPDGVNHLNDSAVLSNKTLYVGAIPNDEQSDLYYSIPYKFINLCIVSTESSGIKTSIDLFGKNVQITNIQRVGDVRLHYRPKSVVIFSDFAQAVEDVKKGNSDAIICSISLAWYGIKKNNISGMMMTPMYNRPIPLAIATRDSSIIPKVNDAISCIFESGDFNKITNKWFITPPPETPKNIIFILIVLCVFLAFAITVIFFLQRKLRKSFRRIGREYQKLDLAVHAGDIKVWGYRIKSKTIYSVSGGVIPYEMDLEKALGMFIHPEDHSKYKENINAVLQDKQPPFHTIRYTPIKGEPWRIVRNEYTALRSGNKIETIIGTHREITQEYEYKANLEYQQRKMALAMDEDDILLWEYDNKTQLFTCENNSLSGVRGTYSFGIKDYLSKCHPGDAPQILKAYNCMNQCVDEHTEFSVRFKLTGDTDWRYGNVVGRPLQYDENGKVWKYVGLRRDNTKTVLLTKKVENYAHKINYILVSSRLLIYDYDIIAKRIVIKSGDNNIISLSREEYLERIYWEDRKEVSKFFDRLDNAELEDFSEQRRVMVPNSDKFRHVHLTGIPIKEENGKIIGYSGLRRDITELIETQERLKNAKIEAENADKLKSAFLANMSHEIRTPLNAIVGFSQLLADVETKEEHEEFIQIINTNTEILLQLIGDILDLSKIEAGMLELKPTDMDMCMLFKDMEASLRHRCTNPDVEIVARDPYSECIVHLDSNRIAQIIMNYGTNAIKYTPKGTIILSYTATDSGLRIEVSDTGIGIAREKYNRIFHRFEKLDDFAQGTGLGLSICKALVDQMGGVVGFTSEEGKGSTFYAEIPSTPRITRKIEKKEV